MADMLDLGYGAAADNTNPYLGTGNPYLQNIVDLTTRDMTDAYNRTAVPAQNAAALRSGSFGNSGLQELAQADARGLQTSIGDAASKLRFNDYTQQQDMYRYQTGLDEGQRQFDLNYGRNLFNDSYAQNMGNLQTGIGLLGTLQGFNANDITNTTNQQNTPLQYWQQFMNGANAIGQGYGTSTSTQGTTSNPVGAALGGAQLGNSFQNWWTKNNSGTGSGTQAPASGNYDASGWNNWATYGNEDD